MKNGFLIDMDGVIYTGDRLIPGADQFINNLIKHDIPFTFITNNSQRTRLEVVRKLKKLGIDVPLDKVYTSAMATGEFISNNSTDPTAFVLGEGGLLTSLHENGVTLVDTDPEFVVLGEGWNFTFHMVQKAVDMILSGAKFVATNMDPSPRIIGGVDNLGIAATAAMIQEAAGRKPYVTGKPSPTMMQSARKYIGLDPEGTTIIGDTLETDIQGGVQVGFQTVLVLSGVSKLEDVKNFAFRPGMIIESLHELKLPRPQREERFCAVDY
jgi:NagD protein